MHKRLLLLLVSLASISGVAQTPDFSIMGFATLNGGTTGGQGGEVVTPTTFDELNAYCTAPQPLVILIDREFKGSNPDAANPNAPVRRILRLASNKTLLGVGDKGFLNQISININAQQNIIIRNIRFTMTDVPVDRSGSEVKIMGTTSDPDIISIAADLSSVPAAARITRNIWIDHCEFYNEDPAIMTDGDRYDGLLDIKNDVQFVTISWCYFHDHHKGCLSGSGSSDNYDRKTTMHHNLFENISSRTPLQRFGKLHFLNNYVVGCQDGVNVRIESEAVVEKNYFKDTKKPIFGKPAEGGKATEIDNYFANCNRLSFVHIPSASSPNADPLSASEEYNAGDYVIPYAYSTFVTEVADVPALVTQWAGVGKIGGNPTSTASPYPDNIQEITFSPTLVTDQLVITLNAKAPFSGGITLTDMQGKVLLRKTEIVIAGNNEMHLDLRQLSSGFYLCQVNTGKGVAVGRVYKTQ